MINKPTIEELLPKVANRYELVNIISQRARQLVSGDKTKIETDEPSKVTIASLEFKNDKIQLSKRQK